MEKAKSAEGGADKGVGEWKKVIAAVPDRARAASRARARAAHRAVVGAARRRAEGRRGEGRADAGARRPTVFARARRGVRQAQQRQPGHLVADAGDPSRSVAARDAYDKLAALYEEQEALARSRQGARTRRPSAPIDGDGKVAIYLQVANLYLERFSNQAEAIKAFEKVLELDPNNHAGGRAPARGLREASRLGEADQAQGSRDRARARGERARQGHRGRQDGGDEGQEARDLHVLVGEGCPVRADPRRGADRALQALRAQQGVGQARRHLPAARPTRRPTRRSAPTRCSASASSTPRRSRTARRRSTRGRAARDRREQPSRAGRAQEALRHRRPVGRARGVLHVARQDRRVHPRARARGRGRQRDASALARDEDRGALPRHAAEGRSRDARVREGARSSTRTTSPRPRR